MAIMQALALLAGGAGGYMKRQKDDKEEARQAEDDAFRREQRQRQRVDWQRHDKEYADTQAEKDAVKQAAATTTVDDAMVVPPIGSRDEPRAPEDQGIRAAGKTFTDRAAADAAAADYNAAPSRMRRAAGAMSDPVRAGQLEASANTAEAGAMQMRAAKLKEADDAYNREVLMNLPSMGWANLEAHINDTKGDGQGGALKVKIVPSPDGKTVVVNRLGPAGEVLQSNQLPNNEEGWGRALGTIALRLSPTEKLAHMQGTAKTAEEARRWGLEYDLKKTDSETRGKREDRMAKAAERQAAAAERTAAAAAAKAAGAGQPAAPAGLAMKDADKFINELFTSKDEMTGKVVFDPMGAQAVRGLMLRMPAAQAGDTQGAVNQALAIYNQAIKVAGGDHEKAMKAIQQAARPPVAPPATAQAAAPGRPAPAAVAPPTAAAVAAPVDPMTARAAQESSELNRGTRPDFSPEVKQYLQQRKAAEAQAAAQASAEYRAKELARAVAASKAQLGR